VAGRSLTKKFANSEENGCRVAHPTPSTSQPMCLSQVRPLRCSNCFACETPHAAPKLFKQRDAFDSNSSPSMFSYNTIRHSPTPTPLEPQGNTNAREHRCSESTKLARKCSAVPDRRAPARRSNRGHKGNRRRQGAGCRRNRRINPAAGPLWVRTGEGRPCRRRGPHAAKD